MSRVRVSALKQGADGVEAKHPYTGAQVCLGYMGGSSIPSDYYGLPYTTLKNALNYYGSLFGVRAVLWHQGEADADVNVNPIYKATSAADYQTKLQAVIAKSRADFVAPNLTWYVSKASFSKFGPINARLEQDRALLQQVHQTSVAPIPTTWWEAPALLPALSVPTDTGWILPTFMKDPDKSKG